MNLDDAGHSQDSGPADPDFLLLDGSGGRQARLRFGGRLEGRDVVWDCRFEALPAGRACYIEVGPETDSGRSLRVGLTLPRIDVPAIRKMIVMIRNYRPLKPGRHEFGGGLPDRR
ncbi:MAG TPA: hypothetical protein ENK05_04425 [Gammaproteobacteria bacterium]|nr:hypothetical protein [Gammaproteobacteria bacterium]